MSGSRSDARPILGERDRRRDAAKRVAATSVAGGTRGRNSAGRADDRRRGAGLALTGGAVVLGVLVAAIRATPWPAALLIRGVFEKGARETLAEMAPHVPIDGFTVRRDIDYGATGRSTRFDLFLPAVTRTAGVAATATDPAGVAASDSDPAGVASTDGGASGASASQPDPVTGASDAPASRAGADGALPVVVWIHGGAWISGSKVDVDPYLTILATRGYAAVALDYTIAPEAIYPTALTQLNTALAYLVRHAQELGIDPSRIVLAGDSAGAQLASQLAVLTTNPDYARRLGLDPALSPTQLVGTVLHCGLYDLKAMAGATGIVGWGFKTALWAYTGDKNWSETPAGTTMSTIDFVTQAFPPTFISGGNGDGLTAGQSVRLAQRMRDAGVDVTSLFWPAGHEPALPHEYQFHLDFEEASTALERTVEFLDRVTGAPGCAE